MGGVMSHNSETKVGQILSTMRCVTPSRFFFIGAAYNQLPLARLNAILSREVDDLQSRYESLVRRIKKGDREIRVNARCRSAYDLCESQGFSLALESICKSLRQAGVQEGSLSDSNDLVEALLCQLEQRLGLHLQEPKAAHYTRRSNSKSPLKAGN